MAPALKRHSHNGLSDSLDKLSEDVSRIKEDLAETAQDVAGAKRGVSGSIQSAKKQGRQAATSLAEQIEERSWTSVAVAEGAGVLLGMLLTRKG